MFQRALRKFRKDPIGFARRAVNKLVIDRFKYASGGDYDAQRYWSDRLASDRAALRNVGDEGLSEAENEREYQRAADTFRRTCEALGRPLSECRVLEIGCGTGFYTQLLHELGVSQYVGIDITDVCFGALRSQFPDAEFRRADITSDAVEGTFDLVVMIDVIEHIVTRPKLATCLRTIDASLRPSGAVILAPLIDKSRRHLFYVRCWSLEDVKEHLPSYTVAGSEAFRDGRLVTLEKPA